MNPDLNPFDLLEQVALAPVLLVGSDYDGTLAPIVGDPSQAFPQAEVMVALKALAGLHHTHVAIISGRSLRDLATLTGSPGSVHLVGSHGSEFEPGFADQVPLAALQLLEEVCSELETYRSSHPGVRIERKPAGVAFHYRQVAADEQAALVESVTREVCQKPGIYLREGKKVIELSVVETHKGHALETLRSRVGATACIYLGDDRTDEDAFAILSGPDLGIKVGDGSSRAGARLGNPGAVARFLAQLAERRAAWLAGSEAVPIEEHAFITDQRTAALITNQGRITWFCPQRIDSPAIFAELLGGPNAGHFTVRSAEDQEVELQEYEGDSFCTTTHWHTFRVHDYLDSSGGRPMQRAGRTDLIRVLEGHGLVEIEFAPRLDFGRTGTRLTARSGGLEIEDTPDPLVLHSPGVEWRILREGVHDTARATISLDSNPVRLELRCGTGDLGPAVVPEEIRRQQNHDYWASWCAGLRIPKTHADIVRRSALVLKGLCYGPTGAIAAAATTSLPEHLGGVRNWDYRYCWLRDAALTAEALVELGSQGEAMRFLDWVLGVVDRCLAPEQLRPVYTVTGSELGTEAEITELCGYGGSRPVRVGNAASRQVQLDVFGPLVQLVSVLLEDGAPLSAEHWRLVEALVTAVERRWHEPDHGIWEVRGPRRHFVHSKVMCWQAVDRALRVAERFIGGAPPRWQTLRDEIAADVLEHGWKPEVGTFAAAYDGTDLDAAVLQIGLSGLIPGDDPRFVSTVETIDKYLRDGATVYRYRFEDGLPGIEGGFHICTSWLIESFLLIGRVDDAQELLEQQVALAGRTGLFPEQYDPQAGVSLGNHPQAYTHLGIARCAIRLERALAPDPEAVGDEPELCHTTGEDASGDRAASPPNSAS